MLRVFFFKQKTAYEMRITDWSSDVCSSDLPCQPNRMAERRRRCDDTQGSSSPTTSNSFRSCVRAAPSFHSRSRRMISSSASAAPSLSPRSEEHTSELQSLMRISYAVFCLKKKKTKNLIRKDNRITQNITTRY